MSDRLLEWTQQPMKVCWRAMERAERRGLIECGVSLRTGWLTDAGRRALERTGMNTYETTCIVYDKPGKRLGEVDVRISFTIDHRGIPPSNDDPGSPASLNVVNVEMQMPPTYRKIVSWAPAPDWLYDWACEYTDANANKILGYVNQWEVEERE